MKIFKDIPREKYNDISYNLEFLKNNKIIGNEDSEYNGIFHVHWRGPLSDKQIFTVKSIIATQKISKIYFWIEDKNRTFLSPGYTKLIQFGNFLEIKLFDKSIIQMLNGDIKDIEKICRYYDLAINDDVRYRSDIFRFVVLSLYGGIYLDLDMFLLKDLSDIHLNRWCSKWENQEKGEGAILKLEKESDIWKKIMDNDPKNRRCFWIFDSLDFKNTNLEITALPGVFFDIMCYWKPIDINGIQMETFHSFWEKTSSKITMKSFLPNCFAFHWHNNWNKLEYKNSIAGKLNEDLDLIIQEKYSIKPIKIFQNE